METYNHAQLSGWGGSIQPLTEMSKTTSGISWA